jgi:hypothetical protein
MVDAPIHAIGRQAVKQFKDDSVYTWDLDEIADVVTVAVLQKLESVAMETISEADKVHEIAPLYRFVHSTLQKELKAMQMGGSNGHGLNVL